MCVCARACERACVRACVRVCFLERSSTLSDRAKAVLGRNSTEQHRKAKKNEELVQCHFTQLFKSLVERQLARTETGDLPCASAQRPIYIYNVRQWRRVDEHDCCVWSLCEGATGSPFEARNTVCVGASGVCVCSV